MNFNEFDRPFMVYGYCRISRDEKLSNEKSEEEFIKTIDEQRKLIEDFAKSKSWNDIKFFSEESIFSIGSSISKATAIAATLFKALCSPGSDTVTEWR